jgi:hypothetical protein
MDNGKDNEKRCFLLRELPMNICTLKTGKYILVCTVHDLYKVKECQIAQVPLYESDANENSNKLRHSFHYGIQRD